MIKNNPNSMAASPTGFLNPEAVVENFNLKPAMVVADFGAGEGRYAMAMLPKISPGGKLYAIDVQLPVVKRFASQAKQLGYPDDLYDIIHTDLEQENATQLKSESVDFVLIANLLFLSENKEAILKEAVRILKPKSRLVIIDWTDSFAGLGPPADMLVDLNEIDQILTRMGTFVSAKCPPSHHHFIVEYTKK